MYLRKKLLFVLLPTLLIASSLEPQRASARITAAVTPTLMNRTDEMRPVKEKVAAARQTIQHTSADKEVDRRIAALDVLMTRISGMKRVSEDQKTALLVQVQTATTDLKNLKAKIDTDTDEETLKADKQSIVTSYRVFLLLIPKVDILAHADLALQLSSQMTTNDSTIQTRIQAEQDKGKKVDAINDLFTDRKAKIADAQVQATNVISSVSALNAAGYPANKPTLLAGKTTLKTVREDLTSAYQDLVKINAALAALK